MSRKILITGSNGQLGHSLVMGLKEYFDIIPTVHKKLKNSQNNVEMDITNPKQIKSVLKSYTPDIVINCAAMTNVDLCESNHTAAWNINVNGLENIIKYTNKNTLIIQISTDYIFDGNEGPYIESDATYPINYYGKTKHAAENLLIGSRKKYLIFRPNVLFSTDLSYNNFFSWVFWSLSDKKEINVVTDQSSNPTWTGILCDAIRESIIFQSEGVYHYGSDNYLTRYEFAQEIANIFQLDNKLIHPIKTSELNQNAKRPMHSGLITNKIEEEIGVTIFSTSYCLQTIRKKIMMK